MEGSVQSRLKQAMRDYPQGVTVATAVLPEGLTGITVSSFTSVSMNPPLVLISIAKGSEFYDSFRSATAYAINFLAHDQESLSDRFAGRTKVRDRFEGVKFVRGVTGSPIITGARAVLECRPWRIYEGGDHSIMVGEVVSAKTLNSKPPLVYYSQKYTTIKARKGPTA